MPVTKEDVLASLASVATPDGSPLSKSGRLSDIVATDGKVFFSINVEAGAVPRWEAVRKAAEAAVRALPDIKSVMVALTAERAGGSGGPAPAAAAPHSHGRRTAAGPVGHERAGRRRHHRGGVRQGRRRQVDDRGQSRARVCATSG